MQDHQEDPAKLTSQQLKARITEAGHSDKLPVTQVSKDEYVKLYQQYVRKRPSESPLADPRGSKRSKTAGDVEVGADLDIGEPPRTSTRSSLGENSATQPIPQTVHQRPRHSSANHSALLASPERRVPEGRPSTGGFLQPRASNPDAPSPPILRKAPADTLDGLEFTSRKVPHKKSRNSKVITDALLLAVLSIAVTFLLWYFWHPSEIDKPNFCNSEWSWQVRSQLGKCVACPEYGLCADGNLVECDQSAGFQMVNNFCLKNASHADIARKCHHQVEQELISRACNNQSTFRCSSDDMASFTLEEMKLFLKEQFLESTQPCTEAPTVKLGGGAKGAATAPLSEGGEEDVLQEPSAPLGGAAKAAATAPLSEGENSIVHVDCTDEEHWETTERFFIEDSVGGIGALSVEEDPVDPEKKIVRLNAALGVMSMPVGCVVKQFFCQVIFDNRELVFFMVGCVIALSYWWYWRLAAQEEDEAIREIVEEVKETIFQHPWKTWIPSKLQAALASKYSDYEFDRIWPQVCMKVLEDKRIQEIDDPDKEEELCCWCYFPDRAPMGYRLSLGPDTINRGLDSE